MKNFRLRGTAILLATLMTFCFSSCSPTPAVKNEGIYVYHYDDETFQLDSGNTEEMYYLPGDRNVTVRCESNIDENKPFATDAPYGWGLLCQGFNYYNGDQFLTTTFVNKQPVKVIGQWEETQGRYVYIGFGEVVDEKEINQAKVYGYKKN